MPAKTPTVSYGDCRSPGHMADHWQKPSVFVDRMVNEGKLVVNERGLITNSALHAFYKNHGTELDD